MADQVPSTAEHQLTELLEATHMEEEQRQTASSRVLNTTELLEAILLGLPMRDLLLSQRVSKHWKSVIDSSTPIQKGLFFLPAEPSDPNVRGYPAWKIRPSSAVTIQNLSSCRREGESVVNPLLCARNQPPHSFHIHLKPQLLGYGIESSCHRMLISQPPAKWETTYVEVQGRWSSWLPEGCGMRRWEFEESRGYRFGELAWEVHENVEELMWKGLLAEGAVWVCQ